ncbi:tripartite tricarboxylate transporter permease [Shumkonia mesophila]|uniref:tripartite tricarboxylate transporter permease n=1 Tax=Shumkonia mesophila TaxID=2838854 RepID=UPI0029350EBD|nr:tripartite tricarboxylate transporter permease [Shumkonia mesophila]
MSALAESISYIITPLPFALCVIGVLSGIVVGAIPGFSGAMLIAMSIPLTYFMTNVDAMVLLISMYVGSVSGGLISATLLKMPGTPSSIMTTMDGFPMAQSGNAARALGLGISASFVGGLISWFFLYFFSPVLAIWGTRFGPWEIFSMVVMALALIASLSKASLAKGLLAALLGVMASLPGIDKASGTVRLTFGFDHLASGFELVPVLLGIFVFSQAFSDLAKIGGTPQIVKTDTKSIFLSLKDWKDQSFNMIRSSLVGTWIGFLPGVGGSVASIVSYTVAKNSSKTPEKYGTGFPDGIVASESANNGSIGGALIPLVTLGIPGSTVDAILIGALLLHNLQPGPMLYVTNPEIINTIIATCLFANVVMFFMMSGLVRQIAKLSVIPPSFMMSVIILCCLLGAIAISSSVFDVWVTLGFGCVGYAMYQFNIPHAPFVIGFILAELAESALRTALMASAGSLEPIVYRPVALAFIFITVFMLIYSMRKGRKKTQE